MNVSVASGAASAAAIVFAVAFAPHAGAQAWPAKTVRIVMPFPPGGGTDQMGRLFAKRFTETFGQTFFAENRPGAGGLIGAEIVAKSPPDGYTILVTTASLSVNASLHRKLTFDPLKDLAPVSWLVSVPLLLAAHPSVPAKTPQEDIVAKLHAETVKGLALFEVRKHLTTDGAEPVGSTPEELGVFFGREVAKYAKIIARANIRAD